jgi:hypothetical protein
MAQRQRIGREKRRPPGSHSIDFENESPETISSSLPGMMSVSGLAGDHAEKAVALDQFGSDALLAGSFCVARRPTPGSRTPPVVAGRS